MNLSQDINNWIAYIHNRIKNWIKGKGRVHCSSIYLAGPQNPYKISIPILPLHIWFLLPLKLRNKLNLPLWWLEEYRILPYSQVNNSKNACVKQH